MTVKMPHQCFINGQFTDADDGKTYDTINPTDGSVSNYLACAVTTGHEFFLYKDFILFIFYFLSFFAFNF